MCVNIVSNHMKSPFYTISCSIKQGEFVVFSGKTTLLNIIGGIEKVDAGKVFIDGLDLSKNDDILKAYREKLGFLFQNFALVENKTVEENILMIDKKYRNNTTVSAVLEKVGFIYFVRWRTAKSSHCASVYEKMQYYIGR